jgi:hypothetical protein
MQYSFKRIAIMAPYKMQVKLIGPHGETLDSWIDEVPPDALYTIPGTDTKTPGKCYFRGYMLTNMARKITEQMLQFMQSRGWHRDPTPAPSLALVPVTEEEERIVRAI